MNVMASCGREQGMWQSVEAGVAGTSVLSAQGMTTGQQRTAWVWVRLRGMC